MFIIISPDEEHFNIFIAMNEIHRHTKKLTEKYSKDKTSERLLELEFK